uniref:Uncharacterized protein n=1 Tax=Pseudictyota dubia TaxID=2749911 RepID=A0A7R9Z3B4_9STRA|mmetsp:Transcript_22164/g.41325  ORF Transcript_22164/g.41325 Transcript_22164/m.41325 type:complete len:154 (+) Transcript_22164:122-583(+)
MVQSNKMIAKASKASAQMALRVSPSSAVVRPKSYRAGTFLKCSGVGKPIWRRQQFSTQSPVSSSSNLAPTVHPFKSECSFGLASQASALADGLAWTEVNDDRRNEGSNLSLSLLSSWRQAFAEASGLGVALNGRPETAGVRDSQNMSTHGLSA